jgi:ferrous iron transport protein A
MIPLTIARVGEENSIKKVFGKEKMRQFLGNLGFVPGSQVTLIIETSENVIVSIKESRVAVSREMAEQIMV